MNKTDNNKATPGKETDNTPDRYSDVEHGNNPEIHEPKPSTAPGGFPEEMPVRENK